MPLWLEINLMDRKMVTRLVNPSRFKDVQRLAVSQ